MTRAERPQRGLILALALSAASLAAGETPAMRPYVDPSQLDVPWPRHSHVKQPWRGFLETKPATELLDGIGMCFHFHGGSMEAQLGLLAATGIRCIRWEQPFGSYDPDIKAFSKQSEARYRQMLRLCKRLGILPIILLNAHHGYPCKLKHFERRLAADAPKGATELILDSVDGLQVLYSGTNGLTDYWAGEVLFTEIDPERKAVKLSKPFPKDMKKGDKLSCVAFYYLPFHPVGTPEFEHTAGGWLEYARAVLQAAREEGIAIELELWNELSFGSHFAGGRGINAYWPGRATFKHDFLRPGGHAWELSRRTLDMAKRDFPGTRVIWGWSNTTFFHTPIKDLPPGMDGQSYHPYGTGWRDLPEREQDPRNPARCLEGGSPNYRLCFAEGWAHTAIQCESLMHHLRPDRRLAARPQGVERFHHYITEHGIVPAEAGVKGDAASLRLKEKFILRALLFWLNKGLSRITLFVSGPDKNDEGMGFHLAKVRELKAMPPEGELDAWLSPALLALRRALRAFEGAQHIPNPHQFQPTYARLAPDRKVFEMPQGNHVLSFSQLFAILPFQVTERKWVIALYEMTPNYNIEDLGDIRYRITLRPLAGKACKLAYYDPLANKPVTATILERLDDALTLQLSVTDTPRLLTIEE